MRRAFYAIVVLTVLVVSGHFLYQKIWGANLKNPEDDKDFDGIEEQSRANSSGEKEKNSQTRPQSGENGGIGSLSKNENKRSLLDLQKNLKARPQGSSKQNSPFYKMALEAVKLINAGKYEKGVEMLLEVLQKDPSNQVALEGLGLYYLDEGKNLEKAQQYFQKLVDLNPNNSIAVNEMAFVLEELKGVEGVESYLREQLEKSNNSPAIAEVLGHTLTRQGKLEEGIPFLESAANAAIAKSDKESAAYLFEDVGNLQIETGNPAEAKKSYRRAINIKEQILEEMKSRPALPVSENSAISGVSWEDYQEDILNTRLDLVHATILTNECDEARSQLTEIGEKHSKDDAGYQMMLKELQDKCPQ